MSKATFSRFDPADYLESEDEIAEFIEIVLADSGDDAVAIQLARDAGARARARLAQKDGL